MRRGWLIINIVFWTMVLGLGGIFLSIFEWRGRIFGWIGRFWAKIMLFASGVSYSVKGLDRLDPKGHYIFASNHESAFDILLCMAGLPYHIVSIAKKELKKIPIFGWAMWVAGHIFVDRTNHGKAIESLKKAKESLKKNPRSVLLYPEGTRSLDGKIHQFKKGGLLLAVETKMPVVPVAMCGTSDVVTKGSWSFTSASIEMRIGDPIHTDDLTYRDRNQFVEQVRNEVIRLKTEWIEEQNRSR